MQKYSFKKELYPKIALIKAAYSFTDRAYIHLDADEEYYSVTIETKHGAGEIDRKQFLNEMLTQSVRHMIYEQTRNIRELMLARAMATTVVAETELGEEPDSSDNNIIEESLLRNWFEENG